jgi:hypothetical protein
MLHNNEMDFAPLGGVSTAPFWGADVHADLGYIQRTVWSLLQGDTIPLPARTTYPTSFNTANLCDEIAQLVTEQAGTIKMLKGAILKSYSVGMNLKLKLKDLADVARNFGWLENGEQPLANWFHGQLAYALTEVPDDTPAGDDQDFFKALDKYLDGDVVSLDAEDPSGVEGFHPFQETTGEEYLTPQEQKQVEISDTFLVLENLAEEAGEEILVEALADLHLLWNVAALPEPGLAKMASDVRKMLGDFLQAENPDLRRAEACLYDTALLKRRADRLLPGKEAATLPSEDERRKKVSDFVRGLLRGA